MRLIFNKTALFYAEYNVRLLLFLLFSKADIYLSNDTDTLVSNYLASAIRKKALVFDAHEMFPEVPELTQKPFSKSIWTKIEDWIFPRLKHCYTVCESIADNYNRRYGISMQVVRNIPFSEPGIHVDKKELASNGKRVLLYQGAVNVGRGVEWMIEAMPYLDDCIFYIAGDGDVMPEIRAKVKDLNLENRVVLLGKIPLEELPSYTRSADIGISLLANMGLNYYYSLPNRIFDFMRAGVPVLATDFPEIRRMIDRYGIGQLTGNHEPRYLASTIQEMLAQEKNTAGFEQANAELSWENESLVLLNIINGTA